MSLICYNLGMDKREKFKKKINDLYESHKSYDKLVAFLGCGNKSQYQKLLTGKDVRGKLVFEILERLDVKLIYPDEEDDSQATPEAVKIINAMRESLKASGFSEEKIREYIQRELDVYYARLAQETEKADIHYTAQCAPPKAIDMGIENQNNPLPTDKTGSD